MLSKERFIQLNSNNLKKYLLYGTIEVILVVSGILIALQINNWDENRKQSTKNIELIDLLITDLDIKKNEDHTKILPNLFVFWLTYDGDTTYNGSRSI